MVEPIPEEVYDRIVAQIDDGATFTLDGELATFTIPPLDLGEWFAALVGLDEAARDQEMARLRETVMTAAHRAFDRLVPQDDRQEEPIDPSR